MSTWIVDVDGTLALRGLRGPYDWSRVDEDKPNRPVIELVQALAAAGHEIIVVSGRMDCCCAQTAQWLVDHGVPFSQLHMRETGDRAPDAMVKSEILQAIWETMEAEGRQDESLRVLDDRQQCVDMWRAQGIFCAQVAKGNF